MAPTSRFKSAQGEAAYKAAYAATLALWPVAHEPIDVQTRFGMTHLNTCGLKDAPPLALLPGGLMNSTYWYLNVAAFSENYRVYAVDTLGDYGLSVLQHKLKDRDDCAEWLEDVFDGLQLERADLVGHSYGGWQALNYALHSPQRIERLVLLSPAYTLLRIYFNFWFLHVLPMQTIPRRSSVNSFIKYVSALPQANILFKEMVEQLYQGVKNIRFPPQIVRPFVFSDDELSQVVMPALVVIGDKEVIYDPQAALKRAARLIPCCETEIIPNAGHDLMRDQPALVNRSILRFLDGQVRHVRTNPSLQIG